MSQKAIDRLSFIAGAVGLLCGFFVGGAYHYRLVPELAGSFVPVYGLEVLFYTGTMAYFFASVTRRYLLLREVKNGAASSWVRRHKPDRIFAVPALTILPYAYGFIGYLIASTMWDAVVNGVFSVVEVPKVVFWRSLFATVLAIPLVVIVKREYGGASLRFLTDKWSNLKAKYS